MTCRHRRGTTSFPPPATRRPQRRHPPSTPRARSPPRTAADPPAGPPAGGPATAGPAYQSPALPSLSDVPSQHLAFEVLRRLVESAVYAPAAVPGGQTLVGTPVSPGVHEGVVRVVASPVNAGLQPGEVLVAATTDPGWTPLFLTAGALVMEIGCVVAHGALVAREYGLPAVTAVVDATTLLETGQRVRVDGAAGTVTVLSEA